MLKDNFIFESKLRRFILLKMCKIFLVSFLKTVDRLGLYNIK